MPDARAWVADFRAISPGLCMPGLAALACSVATRKVIDSSSLGALAIPKSSILVHNARRSSTP